MKREFMSPSAEVIKLKNKSTVFEIQKLISKNQETMFKF